MDYVGILCVHYCLYVCSIFSCVHCFCVCSLYIGACSFLCGCNVLPWRAFVLCSLCSRFDEKPSSLFAVPFARFASRSSAPCHLVMFCRFADLLPYVCPNVCNVHCIRFLIGFKRVDCVVRTFAPFALFRALI